MSQTKAQLIDPVDGTIVDADINASAAIAGTKISPSFTSDITVTNTAPTISFVDSNADSDFRIRINDGSFKIQDITNSGNSRLVIDSNGKVGIGTTSPTGLLSLLANNPNIQFNDNDTSNNAEITLDNTGFRIESDESNAVDNSSINFRIDASEKARIDSSGNVGIGTTSPVSLLHVRGSGTTNLRVDNSDDGTASFTLGNTGSSNLVISQTSANATFSIGGSEFVRITSAGKVGIGTSSPSQLMELASTAPNIRLTDTIDGHSELDGNAASLRLIADKGNAKADTTITFLVDNSEKMRIDSSGKLGIGTTNPQRLLHQHEDSSGANYHVFTNTTTGSSGTDGLLVGISADENALLWMYEDNVIRFATNNTERMRIDNAGALIIGGTTANGAGTRLNLYNGDSLFWSEKTGTGNHSNFVVVNHRATGSTKGNALVFRNSALSSVGTIRITNTGTEFNTTSDYRLKENVVEISDGITRLKALKPSRFNFIADETNTLVDGFLAHEVSSVIPEAISGEKDAVVTQALIDSEDVTEGKVGDPIYQEIDQSKIVPLITAALKEAIAKIETLETKVAALEAA